LIQLKDKTGKYIDKNGTVYEEDGEGRTEQYMVTAGISGMADDKVLLWGGGNYANAQESANMDTPAITTLIRKDGTGKIGAFVIDDDTIKVTTTNQSIIITNKSFADLNIDYSFVDSNTENVSRSQTKEGTVSGSQTVLKKVVLDKAGFGKYRISVGKITCNITALSDEDGSASAIVGDFVLKITGKGDEFLYKGSKTLSTTEGNQALSDTIEIDPTDIVIDNVRESITVELVCNYTFNVTKSDNGSGADRAQFTVFLDEPISICSVEKVTVLSNDGFVTSIDGKHSFAINNSGSTMEIIAHGLPTYDSSTHPNHVKGLEKGQLYVLGGALRVQQ
jgi:hypothetical protein